MIYTDVNTTTLPAILNQEEVSWLGIIKRICSNFSIILDDIDVLDFIVSVVQISIMSTTVAGGFIAEILGRKKAMVLAT